MTSTRMNQETRRQVGLAVGAVENKKGEDLAILEMDRASGAFTDYFVLCTGTNSRQIQAISNEVQERLSQAGVRPHSIEGYNQAEWVLLDYVDFVVHIFSARTRKFYDLERLWKSATTLTPADLLRKPAARKTIKRPAVPRASKRRAKSEPKRSGRKTR